MADCFWTDLVGVAQEPCGGARELYAELAVVVNASHNVYFNLYDSGVYECPPPYPGECVQSGCFKEIPHAYAIVTEVSVYQHDAASCGVAALVVGDSSPSPIDVNLCSYTEAILDAHFHHAFTRPISTPLFAYDYSGTYIHYSILSSLRDEACMHIPFYCGEEWSAPCAFRFVVQTDLGEFIWWAVDWFCH